MAIKISQLANLTSVTDGILFPAVDTTGVYTSKKANAAIIKSYVQADFGNAAFSNDYTDLDNTPTIPTHTGNLTNDSGFITSAYITWANVAGKPTFGNVATSDDYNDLINTPTFGNVATSDDYNDLINTPSLANVATSGSYNDLSDVPANVATNIGNVTIDGDLVPTANLAYDLGSSDNRFRDLYLSGNTITIGNATITSNAGAVSIGSLEVTTITMNLGATITDEDDGTGINTAFISGSVGGAAALSAFAPNVSLFNTVGVYEDYANVVITDDSDVAHTWQFANTGILSLPGDAKLQSDSGDVVLGAPADGSAGLVARNSNIANIVGIQHSVSVNNDTVQITVGSEDDANVSYTWLFANSVSTGTLFWPDNTAQTTAYTATFANVAPSGPSDTGVKGDIRYDSSYIYICVDTNTWIRAGREAW